MASWSTALRAAVSLAWHRLFLPHAQRGLLRRGDSWQDWMAHNQLGHFAIVDLQERLQQAGPGLPRISVVMPVFRPDLNLLTAAIGSVQRQLFTHWQLCICDDGSDDPALASCLEGLIRTDSRITLVRLPDNRGISAASNAAADLADGEVLLFLDQDDLITPDCLAEFALAFAANQQLDLAYSDNDKMDMDGRRHSPAFKPGWSPTLLLSHMYMGHALAIRRSLFEAVGRFRSSHDGSQDYDLALRASERARAIQHLPRLLYHWRCAPGSTAISAAAKPRSIAAGQMAVADAVARRGLPATVVQPDWARKAGIGLFELNWLQPQGCLAVFIPAGPQPVTERWRDEVAALLPAGSAWEIIAPGADLGGSLSSTLATANGRHILLLIEGTIPRSADDIARLLGHAGLPAAGLIGGRLEYPDGRIAAVGLVQPAAASQMEPGFGGMAADRHGPLYRARVPHECLAVTSDLALLTAKAVPLILEALAGGSVQIDRHALGAWLSNAVRCSGLDVICAANVVARVEKPRLPRAPAPRPDPWHNPNLGLESGQWQPARQAPEKGRQGPVRLAVFSHDLQREGAQTVLVDLLAGLKATGQADPVVVSPRTGPMAVDLAEAGIPVVVRDFPPRRAGRAALARHTDALALLLEQLGAQAVLANTLENHAAIAAARQVGLHALWWQHEGGPWHAYFRHLGPATRARAFAAFAMAYRVIQVADSTRKVWLPMATRNNFATIRHAMPPAKQQHLRNGARPTARAALDLLDDHLVVLAVGSISARKGQRDIVAAIARLPDPVARRMVVIVAGRDAEASYGDALRKDIAQLPGSRQDCIRLLGEVADTAPLYAAADVFLCCSRQESAPRAIVEAMVSGLPIVTTAVDGIGELVDFDRNALAYEPGDTATLANRLVELATSLERRQWLGDGSRLQAQLVNDYDQMLARFGTLIRQAAYLQGSPAEPIN